MQHGEYLSEDQDPEKGLSPKGKKDIEKAGKLLRIFGISLDLVLTSPKKRSKETGKIIAENLKVNKILEDEKFKAKTPAMDTLAFLQSLHFQAALIAGHLPSLQLLSQALLCENSLQLDFEMGSCCLIETEELTGNGHLKWFLPPKIYEVL